MAYAVLDIIVVYRIFYQDSGIQNLVINKEYSKYLFWVENGHSFNFYILGTIKPQFMLARIIRSEAEMFLS